MPHAAFLFSTSLLILSAIVAVDDLRLRRVRNWVVVIGTLGALFALFSGVQPFWVEPWSGMWGLCAMLAALLPFYALGIMGAGDVKFGAVIGLWFGFSSYLLLIWIGASLLAGLHSVWVVSRAPVFWMISNRFAFIRERYDVKRFDGGVGLNGLSSLARGKGRDLKRSIPYAAYMAAVTIVLVWRIGPPLG